MPKQQSIYELHNFDHLQPRELETIVSVQASKTLETPTRGKTFNSLNSQSMFNGSSQVSHSVFRNNRLKSTFLV